MGHDLIWVGNTLYPRWFVFSTIGIVCFIIIFTIVYLTRDK
jgi:hypothetical protein